MTIIARSCASRRSGRRCWWYDCAQDACMT